MFGSSRVRVGTEFLELLTLALVDRWSAMYFTGDWELFVLLFGALEILRSSQERMQYFRASI